MTSHNFNLLFKFHKKNKKSTKVKSTNLLPPHPPFNLLKLLFSEPHLSLKPWSWTFEALVEVDSNRPNPLVTSVLLTWSADVAFVPHHRWIRNGLAECCESHWVALGGFCEANSPGKKKTNGRCKHEIKKEKNGIKNTCTTSWCVSSMQPFLAQLYFIYWLSYCHS